MKVTVELYGATKDLSKNNFLEFDLKKNSSIKDIKIQILNLIEKSFEGNQNLKKLIESSAFCSEKDEIISENYKINKNQKIGVIPPIGGG
jgi:molybdopterin synthase sulfur carrier subunit|tara:strand:- start:72 stop:341 length:270 start_codon:yes stop_codon:yes gene_type:complete